jgi:hypothetical protein
MACLQMTAEHGLSGCPAVLRDLDDHCRSQTAGLIMRGRFGWFGRHQALVSAGPTKTGKHPAEFAQN